SHKWATACAGQCSVLLSFFLACSIHGDVAQRISLSRNCHCNVAAPSCRRKVGDAARPKKESGYPMVAIPWPTTSSPAKLPHLSAGRLINCYHQQMPATARSPDRCRRAPGLRPFATTARSGHRGSIVVGSTLYAAFADNVTRFDSTGVATNVGVLNGTAKV